MTNTDLNLDIDIYADGADFQGIMDMYQKPFIKGFTTNPTLMRQDGVEDYEAFARKVLNKIKDKPISFEVFADDIPNMKEQARYISSWGDNVYVKIPVSNSKGESTYGLINCLASEGIKLNVTAVFTMEQVKEISSAMENAQHGIISIFAGRIADTGIDPVPYMQEAKSVIKNINPKLQLLWASPRELLNIVQANDMGCDIITVTNGILNKLQASIGKDLAQFSLETVQMFYNDAQAAGYTIKC